MVIGKKLTDLRDNETARQIEAQDAEIMGTGVPRINELEFTKGLLSVSRWALSSKVPLKNSQGAITGIVGMVMDITEQKEAEQKSRVPGKSYVKRTNNSN